MQLRNEINHGISYTYNTRVQIKISIILHLLNIKEKEDEQLAVDSGE